MIRLQNDDVLLFQGDSITHGGRVYSDWDMNHIMGHGYQSVLASKIGFENLDTRPEIINRGVSGDSSVNILKRKEEDIFALNPTVFSLLVGANDCNNYLIGGEYSPERYYQNLVALFDEMKQRLPQTKLIVGEPFHFTNVDENTEKEEIEKQERFTELSFQYADLARKIAKEYGAIFVEYRKIFEKYMENVPMHHLIWDGIHPTYVGHEIMARQWYEVVSNNLK